MDFKVLTLSFLFCCCAAGVNSATSVAVQALVSSLFQNLREPLHGLCYQSVKDTDITLNNVMGINSPVVFSVKKGRADFFCYNAPQYIVSNIQDLNNGVVSITVTETSQVGLFFPVTANSTWFHHDFGLMYIQVNLKSEVVLTMNFEPCSYELKVDVIDLSNIYIWSNPKYYEDWDKWMNSSPEIKSKFKSMYEEAVTTLVRQMNLCKRLTEWN